MMTKAEEREVLKKIQKLVESTGKGSYLDMTFAGIIEQAEENITNDSACNYKEAYVNALDRVRALQKIENENNKTIEYLSKQQKILEEKYNGELRLAKENYKISTENANRANEELNELREQEEKNKKTIEIMQNEIIRLKARLFDMIDR